MVLVTVDFGPLLLLLDVVKRSREGTRYIDLYWQGDEANPIGAIPYINIETLQISFNLNITSKAKGYREEVAE